MNASRASGAGGRTLRRRPGPRAALRAAALTGTVLWGGLQGAAAQDTGAPISLFPPTVSAPAGAPGGASPGQPGADEDATSSTLGPAGGIRVDRLGELDSESLGTLDAATGGLGPQTWVGSHRLAIEMLLRRLPDAPTSPTLRDLTTRALLSSAAAPLRLASGGAPPTIADAVAAAQAGDFLRLRAERLYAMGELEGLNRLLALVPQQVEDPWLAQARVDGLLLAGRDGEACGQVGTGLARFPSETYWAKALVFCQFVAGQTDQALLGLDLLREAAPGSDPAFFDLANLFVGGSAGSLDGAALTPLTLAMLRAGGGQLPEDLATSARPLLLHGVAGLPGASPAMRVEAVERLVEAGALPGSRLAAAYATFEFTEAELAAALTAAEQSDGPRGRALLYRAANRETLVATQAEILRAALLAAEETDRAAAMARALAPVMGALAPTPELAWFAPLAARSLYRVGLYDKADTWLALLRIDGFKHPESQQAYEALVPLRRLAGGAEPLAGELPEDADLAAHERQLLVFVLSRALGQEELFSWLELAPPGQDAGQALPELPSLLALGDAAAQGRRGEGVLLMAVALGRGAPAQHHPLALGYAVSSLHALGLEREARALAIEAALAAGI
jgi:hypothetical protein